jgi:16S rRNA (guanine966-N2)-methyltransferase
MIRITSGIYKGRQLKTTDAVSTRPTQAKLRSALFNSIQFDIPGSKILDLFSGFGGLSFEALSREAAEVTCVEIQSLAVQQMLMNAKLLQCTDRMSVIQKDVMTYLDQLHHQVQQQQPSSHQKVFDVVLCDPPYAAGFELKVLEHPFWETGLADDGKFILEWSPQKSRLKEIPESVGFLFKVREKKYGESVLSSFVKKSATIQEESET